MTDRIHIASAAICNTKGELLVVRKARSTYYMLPGGKIDGTEMPIATLLRELGEELGQYFDESAFMYLGQHSTLAANEANTQVCGDIFRLKTPFDLQITPQAEIEEILWLDRRNYSNYKLAHLLSEFVLPRWLADTL